MNTKTLKCAVTGSNGYVGSRIASFLRKNRLIVYDMARKSPKADFYIPYSLDRDVDADSLNGIDVLIHCAYDFDPVKLEAIKKINVNGSLRLFQAAKKSGVKKIIFISTMAAFDGCKSMYGKAKLEIEKKSKKFGAIIIRPGLVFDDEPGGMVGFMKKLVSFSRVIPIVGKDNKPLYLCHSEDLSKLIFRLCKEKADISKPIIAACENGLTLREIIKNLAAAKKKKLLFIPVPYLLVLFGLKIFEKIGVKIRFKTDNLVSLVNQNEKPDFSATRAIKTDFREFNP